MYGPLIKYGAIGIAFLMFCAALIAYGSHRKQLEWDAAIAKQAVQSAQNVIKSAENTAKVTTKYIKVKGETKTITKIVKKEVIKYVQAPHPVCTLDRHFERVWDRASDRVSPASRSSSGLADTSDSGLTPVEVLSAHADDARSYYELRDAYRALVEWVQTTYALQRKGAGYHPGK